MTSKSLHEEISIELELMGNSRDSILNLKGEVVYLQCQVCCESKRTLGRERLLTFSCVK
jgi:hypothetical protein